MMKKIFDDLINYPGNTKAGSTCHVRVFLLEHEFKAVVVATELDLNPGFSVTNGAELIRKETMKAVWQLRALEPDRITWAEHYPERDGFDLVIFDNASGEVMHWKPFSRDLLETMINQPFHAVEQHV
jgi:hypothetical protein